MPLTIVDREYLKLLKPELAAAIRNGDPDRAASFARELAKLRRKSKSGRESRRKQTPPRLPACHHECRP
jgi:hypothetical protein